MTVYRFGPFRLEREPLLLSIDGMPLALGPKVVETLLALIEHPGEILGKAQLLDRVWPEGFVEEANLAQNIYVIRKALRAHCERDLIETVPRRGYRFNGEVHVAIVQPEATTASNATVTARRRINIGAAFAAAVLLALVASIPRTGVSSRPPAVHQLSANGARLYAMGRFYWNQRTAQALAKSVRYFQSVIASDPHDARGYAGLASAYAIEGDYSFGGISKKEAFARASAYARSALAINSESAEAHAVLGFVAVDDMRMKQGFTEYRRALSIDPRFAAAHQWYGVSLLLDGKINAAYDQLHEAANLDPESVATADWLSQAAFIARRYKEAIAYARQALDLSPERYNVYPTIGMAYEALGDYPAAIAAYTKYSRTCTYCSFDAAALLAHVYAVTHDRVRAEQQLQRAERGVALKKTPSDDVAVALAAMGRKDDALAMLRNNKDHEPAALLAVDPRMDQLRDDARFRQYTQGPG